MTPDGRLRHAAANAHEHFVDGGRCLRFCSVSRGVLWVNRHLSISYLSCALPFILGNRRRASIVRKQWLRAPTARARKTRHAHHTSPHATPRTAALPRTHLAARRTCRTPPHHLAHITTTTRCAHATAPATPQHTHRTHCLPHPAGRAHRAAHCHHTTLHTAARTPYRYRRITYLPRTAPPLPTFCARLHLHGHCTPHAATTHTIATARTRAYTPTRAALRTRAHTHHRYFPRTPRSRAT